MKRGLAIVLTGTVLLAAGCHAGDAFRRTSTRVKQNWSAGKAWRARKWMYDDIACRGSFKDGFKAGYRFACGGCDSCDPPAALKSAKNGGPSGDRDKAQAWSDGFTHGTLAARQDSVA